MDDIETEDLLPRPAPRSASANTAATEMKLLAKPTVPELSMIFGQQFGGQGLKASASSSSGVVANVSSAAIFSQSQSDRSKKFASEDGEPIMTFAPKMSYAEWKKQMGPMDGSAVSLNSNVGGQIAKAQQPLYPFRPSAGSAPAMSPMDRAMSTTASHPALGGYHHTARRSWEGVCCSAPVSRPSSEVAYFTEHNLRMMQRRSLDTVTRQSDDTPTPTKVHSVKNEVLTICAGTQTGPMYCEDFNELVTKRDLRDLVDLMRELLDEQTIVRRFCEILLEKSDMPPEAYPAGFKVYSRSVATQCDLMAEQFGSQNSLQSQGYPSGASSAGSVNRPSTSAAVAKSGAKGINNMKGNTMGFQSPHAVPMARSTGYRANTPISVKSAQRLGGPSPQLRQQMNLVKLPASPKDSAFGLPRPNTEKSMVMNELALKYLPTEKLTELLDDVHVSSSSGSTTPTNASPLFRPVPLRHIENVERSASDISNESYKYLKKYRLLPEEQQQGDYDSENRSPDSRCDDSPLLPENREHMRRISESSQESQEQHPQGLLLGRSPMPPRNAHIDIEQFKGQPKLL